MNRALFLACSRRKLPEAGRLPAIKRYDGPCFRVLRRYIRHAGEGTLSVWILSAEHGLIRGDEPILPYDRTMTRGRADALRQSITASFATEIRTTPFDEAFICMGAIYAHAMSDCWQSLPDTVQVHHARGSIGGQASQLKAWLYRDNEPHHCESLGQPTATKATILGVHIDLTIEEVLGIARDKLEIDSKPAMRFQTKFVRIGQHRISPKWLVSQLTGLAPSRFRTADACRVLNILGFYVEHI